MLSNGEKETLGAYEKIAIALYGEKSAAVNAIRDEIGEAKGGMDSVVKIKESEMLARLAGIMIQSAMATDKP